MIRIDDDDDDDEYCEEAPSSSIDRVATTQYAHFSSCAFRDVASDMMDDVDPPPAKRWSAVWNAWHVSRSFSDKYRTYGGKQSKHAEVM